MNTLQRIKEYIDYKKLTIRKFEEEIGYSNGAFASQLKRSKTIGVDKLENILRAYPEINPAWLLTGKGEMLLRGSDTSKVEEPAVAYKRTTSADDYIGKKGIPLIPIDAMAGFGDREVQVREQDIVDRYRIPEFDGKGVEYIIRVSGSSMYPTYSNGDLLGCRPFKDTTFFQWGKPYVLDTDQGAMVKRLFPVSGDEELLECRSDNKETYPAFTISKKSIYRIAIVVGVVRME